MEGACTDSAVRSSGIFFLPNQIFSVAQEAADGTGAQRPLRGGRQEEKRAREPAGTSFLPIFSKQGQN